MNESIKMLFVDNPELDEKIEAFCEQNPEYLRKRQEFYETAEEIAQIAGFDLYDRFERRFGAYMACSNDIYYLFGLALRQEVLTALGV